MRVAPRAGFVAVLFLLCFAVPTSHAAPGAAPKLMVNDINKARRAHGVAPLRQSSSLRRTSMRYAGFMLHSGYFGHLARIRASGRFRRLGEIIAFHSDSRLRIRETVRRWLKSPPHRAAMLSRRFRLAGAGTRNGRFRGRRSRTWVVQFGSR